MNHKDDLIDLVWDAIKSKGPASEKVLSKRVFFSEYDIKRMIKNNQTLTLPRQAIVSPLAQDWLVLKKIKIIQED